MGIRPLVIVALVALSVWVSGCGASRQAGPPPETPLKMVEETLHGVTVADPYRWLEDQDSAETKQWVASQTAYTRRVLDSLPGRDALRDRLQQLFQTGSLSAPKTAAGRYFYSRKQGDQNQPIVYVREGVDGEDRVLLDPNALSAGGTVTIDWFTPSKDGKLVAYGVSEDGSEISTLRVLDVDSGEPLADVIPKVRGADPQWLSDGSGFYYTRPRDIENIGPGEEVYYRRVFFHRLGADPLEDELIFGDGLKQTEMPGARLSSDERYLLLNVFMGWGKNRLYVLDRRTKRTITIADGGEASYSGEIVGDTLYLLTNAAAPRYRVVAVDLRRTQRRRWRTIVAESEDVIDFIQVVGGRLFVGFIRDAHSVLAAFSLDGEQRQEPALPGLGTVSGFQGEWDGREAFYSFSTFTTPTTVLRLDLGQDLGAEQAQSVWRRLPVPAAPEEFEVDQVFYPSKDGTRVPMFLVRKKGTPTDGTAPGLLYAYGGFNISLSPGFRPQFLAWLQAGGVLAVANLRGGGEYGEQWHEAGMLANKQNVFDDFIAAAEYLAAEKHVSAERLAIYGASNGGLLVGAAMTQRPDLFRAVICGVPLLDMIRYQRFRMARLWISEYGSAEDPSQFRWLHAYSPYHRVRDEAAYPATIIYTGASDSRVDPMHARKMTARLQAANRSPHPILLRVETDAGHGQGKPLSKSIDEWTDLLSFVFDQLGMS